MKTIYLLLLTALLAVGTAACSKEDNGGGAAGDGFGKVNMAFSLESEPEYVRYPGQQPCRRPVGTVISKIC
nr:hypothetical protein [Odoribacter sp. OF09-27XD]